MNLVMKANREKLCLTVIKSLHRAILESSSKGMIHRRIYLPSSTSETNFAMPSMYRVHPSSLDCYVAFCPNASKINAQDIFCI